MNIVRVHDRAEPIDPEIIQRFAELPTPAVSDSTQRSTGATALRPIGASLSSLAGKSMVGTALTVRTRPGDNLAVHIALDMGRPGDILVVDARGETTNAILGELMTSYAETKGFHGIVVDGAVRDHDLISSAGFPVFARGISHMGPYKSGPGEIHGTATIGGVPIEDGDLIIGDADGIVVVPARRVHEVLELAEAVVEKEEGQRADIAAGRWDRSWIAPSVELVRVHERADG
ncbi:RraA family protein [Microcella alkaliphila]|jgi:regulator of RNase E activity RraA|uniref:Putative 4-hydroxy-4-methyl-2-oxoglutarate aldolase n=1 Tax=Microcella alkaliphila TaxID=279828 RepID=A0A0U5B524_9MICO|nr:RraA family protein [Microcella alkaliphila]BAU30980.1 putative transferase [Microcella alkaliphila]